MAFARIPLQTFEWVHFEGRNVPETLLMMQHVQRRAPDLPVSLEVEKSREGIEQLFPFAVFTVVSSDYMLKKGVSRTTSCR